MTTFTFCLTSALEKVFPNCTPAPLENNALFGFCPETVSFQLAYACENDDYNTSSCEFIVSIESPLSQEDITIRRVALVPSHYPCHSTVDDHYLTTTPGLLPDLLLPSAFDMPIRAIPSQWHSVWIDVSLAAIAAGEHPLAIRVHDTQGTLLFDKTVQLFVSATKLCAPKLLHTEWFHADCLADYYQVPVFSERHWEILGNFIASAASHGVNLLLTPVFTPPLDTEYGGARTTVQLVDVFSDHGAYTFGYERLDRWLSLCRKNGIDHIEIAHLFSQWGAVSAPKIMATVDGTPYQLFGWDTKATSTSYRTFLAAFLPALQTHLAALGYEKAQIFFHISDEPEESQLESYRAAREVVSDLLDGYPVIDALSSYRLYEAGLIRHPIPSADHIEAFLAHKVPDLWVYYCMAQATVVPNRFMAMPSSRNRILGALLYCNDIKGFLHWGFNFYNSKFSHRRIDPFTNTDADAFFPSGDAFLVYPAPDGTAYESIRGMVLKHAQYDLLALQTLEEKIGRGKVLAIIYSLTDTPMTFTDYEKDPAFFARLRESVAGALRTV